ncbi:DNA-processing protein DprA [Actinoplanes sp. N902-109]|uniref:DNA-processing protein DprA n=1 Tax=Actinoplanes sp. (strain N902-109) TaxID=649831 RepID=UPI0003294362|nr:DNA-processing protein DprA [Actinoplanes sp. N902-109]AGL20367.1 DNA protecting protein DprA [Actinoplanes sp. N902-109]
MTDADTDRLARVALTWVAEPGNRVVWELVRDVGAEATLTGVLAGDIASPAVRKRARARRRENDPWTFAELAVRRGKTFGARVVVPSDPEWPHGVDALADLELDTTGGPNENVRPPLCLWVRGSPPLNEAFERSVAIVGSRSSTNYGEHVTAELAYGVAEHGWTVVSGGAFGIDAQAHRATLAAGGCTVAVLACGVERPYPLGNGALFEQVCASGLLMSEWPIGAEPQRHRFLIRNRVIAAATSGTVVVEAAARSGALQTMGRVIALGRRAMVVPGPVTSAMSVGCHELLRRHPEARLVTTAAHVLDEVGSIGEYLAEPARPAQHARDDLDEESALVLEAFPRRGIAEPDQLAARAGLGLRTVLRRLTLLEMLGLVERRDVGIVLTEEARAAPQRRSMPPQLPPPSDP